LTVELILHDQQICPIAQINEQSFIKLPIVVVNKEIEEGFD